MTHLIDTVIDIDRYPLHDKQSRTRAELVSHCQSMLDKTGCVSLQNFLYPQIVQEIRDKYQPLLSNVFRPTEKVSPYGAHAEDENLPQDHPRRARFERGGGFIGADQIDPASALWTVFNWHALTEFLREVLRTDALYPYADPIASMATNVMWDGDVFPWHYDTNEFTVSIMVQAPEGGGAFEYVTNSRTPDDECFDRARAIFDGARDGVRRLHLNPGDLQLFKGRYTLHRVAKVEGDKPRIVALPSWSSRPGQVGVVDRMIKSYGRALPIHYERAGLAPDQLSQ